ncbi:unnamed protein product [Cuscuta campestris]|uniref:Uncharacterized protein n=1 Tax=Cuscuta campestris TaxID=132261 RepID=A0A484LFN6_9ASTE|nr:unnamed protein product [Cuscuta campestris]
MLKTLSGVGMFFCGMAIFLLLLGDLRRKGSGSTAIGLLLFLSLALYPAVGFLPKHCWKRHTRLYTTVFGESGATEKLKR